MSNALVIGGNSGVGLSIVTQLLKRDYDNIYIIGKDEPVIDEVFVEQRKDFEKKVVFKRVNFVVDDFSFLDDINDINTLIITVGFGRVALFENLTEPEVSNLLKVNLESCVKIIKHYYEKIHSQENFYTAVMVSIAGRIVSPYFSVYGATKAGLRFFIENVNSELEAEGFSNRILDVSPGSLKGTNFNGTGTNLKLLQEISSEILDKMFKRETLFIPQYNSTYKAVIERYNTSSETFAQESYQYKKRSGRISDRPQVVIGYLSGTFDLFHVGHLNLLKRAKEQCDYLIVGVHDSGAWKGKETYIPFEERCAILRAIKYVDKVIAAPVEDCDAWNEYHYDKLFVGSDYKGSERFNRYEEMFKGKVEIVYFPYTKGTSSTQLREALNNALTTN